MAEKKKERIHRHKLDVYAKDFYKFYRKQCKENGIKALGRQAQYIKIINDINDSIINRITIKAEDYFMPEGLGIITVRKIKQNYEANKLPINWKATKDLWEEDEEAKEKKTLVRHLNEHTNGYIYRLVWIVDSRALKNKTFYHFKAMRKPARFLAKVTKGEVKIDYYEKPRFKLKYRSEEKKI